MLSLPNCAFPRIFFGDLYYCVVLLVNINQCMYKTEGCVLKGKYFHSLLCYSILLLSLQI